MERTKKFAFRIVRRIPFVAKKIEQEMTKQRKELLQKFHKLAQGQAYVDRLPVTGFSEVSMAQVFATNASKQNHICFVRLCILYI